MSAKKPSALPLIVVVGLVALFVIVRIIINSLVFIWPAVLAWGYLKAGKLAGNFVVPDSRALATGDLENEYASLLEDYAAIEHSTWRNIDAALNSGFFVRSTQTTPYPRFDERKRGAREINRQIESSEENLSQIFDRLSQIRASIFDSIPVWEDQFRAWRLRSSIARALSGHIFEFPLACLISFAIVHHDINFITRSLIITSQDLGPVFPSILIASCASICISGWRGLQAYKRLGSILQGERANAWRELRHRWSVDPAVARLDADVTDAINAWVDSKPRRKTRRANSGSNEHKSSNEHASPNDQDRATPKDSSHHKDPSHWSVILGVSEQATLAEVRKAWLQKLKKDHPDHMQFAGEERERAAEEITKILNGAYERACRDLAARDRV